MTQRIEKGLWLRPERKNGKWKPELFVGVAVAMLTSVITILAFTDLTGFRELCTTWPMIITACILCGICGLMTAQKQRNWFAPVMLAMLLLLVLFGRQYLLEGIRLCWNHLGDTWTAHTGRVIPALALQLGDEKSAACLMLFSVAAGMATAMVCCLIVYRRTAVLAVAVPGLLLGAMVWFGKDVSVRHLTGVLMLAVMLLLYSGWEKKKTAGSVLVSWTLCGVVVFISVFVASAPAIQNWTVDVSMRLHETIHKLRCETVYTTLPEGDYLDYTASPEEAQPALVVNMQTPEAMYLRGFTGAQFSENVWSAMDPKVLAAHEDLLYWLNLEAFDPSAQFEAAASLAEVQTNVVTIQNLGACSQYLYVPFSLNSGSWIQTENLNETVDGNQQRMYVYHTVSSANSMIGDVLDQLQNSEIAEVLEYRKAESAYRKFVSEAYLQIPEEIIQTLGTRWDKIAAQYGAAENLTREQAQTCVLAFLSQCFPEEGPAADYNLPLEIAEGSSYQYATVAAMTLRYFGFPARYAEGYIITDEMAAAAQDGSSIQVDSSHAAAWVEVYQDGIGWIPMELTPGFGRSGGSTEPNDNRQDNSSDAEGIGEDTSSLGDAQVSGQPQSQVVLPEQPQQETLQPETNHDLTLDIPQTVLWMLLILIILLILVLAIRRKVLSKRREKKFRGENRNEAAASIFADTAVLLEKMGLDRGNGSMMALFEPASQRFGPEYADMLRAMTSLNAKAMFSSHQLDETQREALLEFRFDTLQRLKTESKWNKRLWMQWILCLY